MLKQQLDKRQIVALVITAERYRDELERLIKFSDKHGKKICYVSLNVPHQTLTEIFKRCKVDPKKFFIVDAVTSTVMTPKPTRGVSFVSSPRAMTELGIQISETYKKHKFDLMLFDSLSTLLAHGDGQDVQQFIHTLTVRIRTFNARAIFPVLRKDMDSKIMKDLNMFMDAVIDATVERMMQQEKLKELKAIIGR